MCPRLRSKRDGNIFLNLKDTAVYIENVGAFSDNWDDHLRLLHIVCGGLVEHGFTVNPLEYE